MNSDPRIMDGILNGNTYYSRYTKSIANYFSLNKPFDALAMQSLHSAEKANKKPALDLYRQTIVVSNMGIGDMWSDEAPIKPNSQVKLACQFMRNKGLSGKVISKYHVLQGYALQQQNMNFKNYARQSDFPVVSYTPDINETYKVMDSQDLGTATVVKSTNIDKKLDAFLNVTQLWRTENGQRPATHQELSDIVERMNKKAYLRYPDR